MTQMQLKVSRMYDAQEFIVDFPPKWLVVDVQDGRVFDAEFPGEYKVSEDGLIDWAGNEIQLNATSFERLKETLAA